jgi:uncharacterized protein YqeY
MSIEENVTAALKDAMKSRDADATRAIRNIRAAFLERRKQDGAETISDEDAVTALRKMDKQLAESIEAYEKGGREDLAALERAERVVVARFLPSLADAATTRRWVEEAIAASGAKAPSDLGKVMGALMAAHKGEIDAKVANGIIRELLTA